MNASHIPNTISYARVTLVVPILWLLYTSHFGWTLIVCGVAGLSDGLDGYLAKRYGWHSEHGALLDPLADKILLVAVFFALTHLNLIPLWLTVIVISRDVIIVSGAFAFNHFIGKVQGRPTMVSKLNTAFQLLYVLAVIGSAGYSWPAQPTLTILGGAVFVTTIVSGLDYVLAWGRRAYRAKQGETK